MNELIDLLGWTGSAMIIFAYGLTLTEKYKFHSIGMYLNLLGGLLIAFNCYFYNAMPPFATNLLWSFIAIIAIIKTKITKRKALKSHFNL